MKQLSLILIVIFLISCNDKEKCDFGYLVNTSIKLNNLDLPITVHKTKYNEMLGDFKNIKLLTTEELLAKKDEKFYSLTIHDYKDSTIVFISNYNSGKDYTTIFNKNNKCEVLKNDYIQTKRGESKPYYIYWAIMRDKYPKYMDWDKFKIPGDSLK